MTDDSIFPPAPKAGNLTENMTMERRVLGSLKVSALGMGAPIYGATGDAEIAALVDCAFDLGINFFDTADAYHNGAHEEALGGALKTRRSKAVIATKFGNTRDPSGRPDADGRPAYVMEACERSLRRLQTDVIDLYYIHRVDPRVPIEETVGAMVRLKELGKIRHLGICEAAPATLKRAHAVHPLAALQTEYSLWSREPETDLLRLCESMGIGFVAYSPLGRGFLTGTMDESSRIDTNDLRRSHPRFTPDAMRRNRALVDDLASLASRENCTAAQLCLAWLLAQRPFMVALPGTRQTRWMAENAAAAALSLSTETRSALDSIFAPGAAMGARYPQPLMARVNL